MMSFVPSRQSCVKIQSDFFDESIILEDFFFVIRQFDWLSRKRDDVINRYVMHFLSLMSRWFKLAATRNGAAVALVPDGRRIIAGGDWLQVRQLTEEDAGRYKCQAGQVELEFLLDVHQAQLSAVLEPHRQVSKKKLLFPLCPVLHLFILSSPAALLLLNSDILCESGARVPLRKKLYRLNMNEKCVGGGSQSTGRVHV